MQETFEEIASISFTFFYEGIERENILTFQTFSDILTGGFMMALSAQLCDSYRDPSRTP